MLHSLRQLLRHRALVQSLVARELKARYRGSTLGLLWSFINPLLLLSIYTFVFTTVMPGARSAGIEPFSLFLFCGLLPWTWFSSSLLESSNSLIAGGNLIRKVLFPAEVLPIVSVFAGLVHFCLGLPILAAFFVYYRVPVPLTDLAWFPLIVLEQLAADAWIRVDGVGADGPLPGSAGPSRECAHARVLSDANHLPALAGARMGAPVPQPESVHHAGCVLSGSAGHSGPLPGWPRLLIFAVVSVVVFVAGYFVFDRLRDTLAEEV